ncbi:hypothetical protein ACFV1N_40440 [Streptosporangium canum]|uniref:hypothetical protein n=1 Tax=Streptosporangium canum TaxID=324952 RepID=UPI0036C27B75
MVLTVASSVIGTEDGLAASSSLISAISKEPLNQQAEQPSYRTFFALEDAAQVVLIMGPSWQTARRMCVPPGHIK